MCATLPFCERVVNVKRKGVAPVWTRRFPVSKQPKTIGEHLRKKRSDLGLRQSEVAQKLGVSERTLSLWECDAVYPTWTQQPSVTAYLGYDPFTNPALGRPLGNESSDVAILASKEAVSWGQRVLKRRLELRKTRRQFAKDLGICVKSVWGWETGRWEPTDSLRERVISLLEVGSRATP